MSENLMKKNAPKKVKALDDIFKKNLSRKQRHQDKSIMLFQRGGRD
jgi:hypothetical protein